MGITNLFTFVYVRNGFNDIETWKKTKGPDIILTAKE